MLLGARQFFERRGAPSWRNPYVTDGLVAMWDGEWNAGGGVHDAVATTWKNLVRGVDLVCSQYASFTDNSLACSSFPGGGTLAYSEEFVNSVQQVEVCARFVPSGGWVRNFLVLVKNGVQDYCGIGTYNNTVRTDFHEDGIVRESWQTPFGLNYFSSKQSCSYAKGVHLSSAHGEYNDTYIVTENFPSTNLPTENYGIFIGHPGGNAPALIDVSCVRLYSRTLTADEIAQNYAIDKVRFNLP